MTENTPITEYSQVPRFRRNGFVILAWILFWPVAIGILWTGDVYYMKKGQLKTYGKVAKVILTILALGYTVQIFGAMGGGVDQGLIEESAVPIVTELLQDELGSDGAVCKGVEIVKEVSEGFYKAKATLANGNEVNITIELQGEDQIFVQIPMEQ
jgi:hypothetical protein